MNLSTPYGVIQFRVVEVDAGGPAEDLEAALNETLRALEADRWLPAGAPSVVTGRHVQRTAGSPPQTTLYLCVPAVRGPVHPGESSTPDEGDAMLDQHAPD